jgi:hypothetical protein
VFSVAIIIAVYIDLHAQGDRGRMFRPMSVHGLRGRPRIVGSGADLRAAVASFVFESLALSVKTRPIGMLAGSPHSGYARLLDWALAHRSVVVGGALGAVVGHARIRPIPRHRVHAEARRRIHAHQIAANSERFARSGHGCLDGC